MSLWEVATLVSLGRLAVTMPLRDRLEAAASPPLVHDATLLTRDKRIIDAKLVPTIG